MAYVKSVAILSSRWLLLCKVVSSVATLPINVKSMCSPWCCLTGAESQRMLDEAAAAADKVRQEYAVIQQANKIYEQRTTKQLPAFPEPKRGKVHWDHVLEEMNWMAKEFSK